MIKKNVVFLLLLTSPALLCASKKQVTLTDKILHDIDGMTGIMDRVKIENTLWLIQELRNIHNGTIKVNDQGIPDPSRASTLIALTFKGKKRTLEEFMEIEKNRSHYSQAEKDELDHTFKQMKDYCEKVNNIVLNDARGTEQFMKKLLLEYCLKAERQDSLLLEWHKGEELDMYRKSITTFKIFHAFSTDLMNFLAALIKSCPKAFRQYKDHVNNLSKGLAQG